MERIKAYIDSFDYITVLIDKEIHDDNKTFYLETMSGIKTKLEIYDSYEEHKFYKYIVSYIPSISLREDYYITDEAGNSGLLRSGSIIRSQAFEDKFKYDGPLGFEYHKTYTIFRVWSPVAKEMLIELIDGNKKKMYPMEYNEKENVWEVKIKGDLDRMGYLIYVRVFDELEPILDPYGISSSANCKFNYVVDINKFYKMKYKKPSFSGNYTDSIIYEVSIRDFTGNLKSNNKGCFLGLLENNPTRRGEPTGLQYIRSLGVTHIQLLPIFDFEGVDDIKKDMMYNWGYNPVQFFVPSGWYSSNPDDPYSRINELLELIDNCHDNGIRVNMDVVFNHIYATKLNGFDKLIPGYSYRFESDGKLSNASGCGNVLGTELYMTSRLICDILKYYTEVFKISGYRFDLMGLLDVDTLNKARNLLQGIEPQIMLYGEGWNMINPLPEAKRPTIYNHNKIPGYAFFNDRFRDQIRGSQWGKGEGYAFNTEKSMFDLNHLLLGSCQDYYRFSSPLQTVNYVECHDNYTFYDFGRVSGKTEKETLDAARLALEIVLISQGIPFIHAGEEFFRTKQGIENSYNTSGDINKFDYKRRDLYLDNVNAIRDLIEIRKKYPEFRHANSYDIENKVHILDGFISGHSSGLFYEGTYYNLIVIIKNDYTNMLVELNNSKMIFDGFSRCKIENHEYNINRPGVYIIRKDK